MVKDFKDYLILLFFRESKGSYIIYDLLRLLSISQEFLETRIEILLEKELLFIDERYSYRISEFGLNYLSIQGFNKINLFEIMNEISLEEESEKRILKGCPDLTLTDIYIPKNFKNVIYSKKELDGLF
ncbi:hypothetical protein [Neobacillus massiliamazoniensis]|uniref:Uncharacterized protein n=1 Tax=Neobacillus massiliamazoniensis TaxID=1499688 RepID=A0A0U1NYB3_9BACI|nr:hypothetical protein [Neobacillus massiliamazoniensis]CRK83035.1 hypothetical protein BN000_02990 [Neobacillus massiliamazoniensis]